jgi:hypothetical protein
MKLSGFARCTCYFYNLVFAHLPAPQASERISLHYVSVVFAWPIVILVIDRNQVHIATFQDILVRNSIMDTRQDMQNSKKMQVGTRNTKKFRVNLPEFIKST